MAKTLGGLWWKTVIRTRKNIEQVYEKTSKRHFFKKIQKKYVIFFEFGKFLCTFAAWFVLYRVFYALIYDSLKLCRSIYNKVYQREKETK